MAGTGDDVSRNQICRAVGYVVAAIVTGFVTWGALETAHPIVGFLTFFVVLAAGLWLAPFICALREGAAHAAAGGGEATRRRPAEQEGTAPAAP
ncbi:MAG TPA: hypothetical protein VFR34_07240, partial [Paracoccaceae bacterium]|nr:hypothetical protein [Paracoccaceae bacterium]